jgi:urocanate hydratase
VFLSVSRLVVVANTPLLHKEDFKLAVQNSLRYFPVEYHEMLMPEFIEELRTLGHIYMMR